MRQHRLLLVLALSACAAASADARRLQAARSVEPLRPLDPSVRVVRLHAGGGPVEGAEWLVDGRSATAAGHALAPTVRLEDAIVVEVALKDGSRAAFRSLGGRVVGLRRGGDFHGGDAWIDRDASEGMPRLVVREAFVGIDEVFELRQGRLEHDLVVSRDALGLVPRGDLAFSWSLELPAGARAHLATQPSLPADVVLTRADGAFLGRIPAPVVADAGDAHATTGPARWELSGSSARPVLTLRVASSWAHDPVREFPLRLDPTVSLEPLNDSRTGFVDEFGNRSDDAIDSGSLADVFFGSDVRGFAQFETGAVPDGSNVVSVHLQVWLANHDNPLDPAVPLPMEIKQVASPVGVPPPVLHAAIPTLGAGVIYASEDVPRTGAAFCADSYAFRDYDLGPQAVADVEAQLLANFFTVGFVSGIVTDPGFDHIDYMGFSEVVNNPGGGCASLDLPDSRITLVVTYLDPNLPPACDSGGPYVSDCPATPIVLDASASSDPDGDPLTYAWTTSCSGTIADPTAAVTQLQLDGSCGEDCTVTVTVSDGELSSACTDTVSAHDLTPPTVLENGFAGAGVCAWPPRHDFVCLAEAAAHVVAVDSCQPGVFVRFVGCVSDQPDEAPEPGSPDNGDGHFHQDCRVSDDGTSLCFRVERAGTDPEGRHYGVAVEVDDGCGNVTVVVGGVFVPHDRRGGSGGQDDPCQRGTIRFRP